MSEVIVSVYLSPEQLKIQELFKQFMKTLTTDAGDYCQGAVQIKVDLQLGVLSVLQKPKAEAYARIMQEIIGVAKDINTTQSIVK